MNKLTDKLRWPGEWGYIIGKSFIRNETPFEAADEIERLRAENKRLSDAAEKLKLNAQAQAQEARTQKSIVHEIYQTVTGSTGEPGDWNGSAPVVERIQDLQDENKRLRVIALKAFTIVEWTAGLGMMLEPPYFDADDTLMEMVELLGAEDSEDARKAIKELE